MDNKEPSIGYSVAYPFGVIGPILCIYFMTRLVQPKFPPKEPQCNMPPTTTFAGSGKRCSGHDGEEEKREYRSVRRPDA